MRVEVENWLKQAEADMRKADILFKSREFDGTVFFCQQSAEKALKAVALDKLRESQKGHSIVYLAQLVKLPGEMMSGVRDLNPEYLIARYPDMASGVPSELYDEKIASRHMETARAVVELAKKQMKK